jgi:hypothetical protein
MQSMRSLLPVLCFFPVIFARAGEFTNLTFDDPAFGRLDPFLVGGRVAYTGNVEMLLKGWSVQYEGNPVSTIALSTSHAANGITLLQNPPSYHDYFGAYSLGIWAMKDGPGTQAIPMDITISQFGRIPKDATGISYFSGERSLKVFADGELVGDQNGFADLSGFSGRDVKLEFRFTKAYASVFDIYGFTTVPEPSEYAMLGLGLGVIGWQAWKRQRAHQPSPRNGGGRGSTHSPSTPADPM